MFTLKLHAVGIEDPATSWCCQCRALCPEGWKSEAVSKETRAYRSTENPFALSVRPITFFLTKFPLMWRGKAVVFHLQVMEDLGRAYNRGAPFAVKPHT